MDNFYQWRQPLVLEILYSWITNALHKEYKKNFWISFFLNSLYLAARKNSREDGLFPMPLIEIEALVVDLFALQGIAWYLVLKNWQGWVEPQASMLWRGKGVPRNQRLYAFGNDTSVCSASYLGMVCQLAAREGESYHKVLNEGWMMSLRRRRITHKYVAKHRKRVRNGHLCEYTGGRNRMDESRKGKGAETARGHLSV